jgi:hypothetical protein
MARLQLRAAAHTECAMKYLVHCILRNRNAAAPEGYENSVKLMACGSLAAAVSPCGHETAAPDSSQLLAYERVISALHASGPVIPLRYGCLIEDESQIGRLLDEHRVEYEGTLDRLENRAEIGLRVLWEPRAQSSDLPKPVTPGAAYLAGIRRRHFVGTGLNDAEREWADHLFTRIVDMYSEARMEAQPAPTGCVVSLYFLVPQASVGWFRERLQRIVSEEGRRFLVSGPWPPYNFVMPEVQGEHRSSGA